MGKTVAMAEASNVKPVEMILGLLGIVPGPIAYGGTYVLTP